MIIGKTNSHSLDLRTNNKPDFRLLDLTITPNPDQIGIEALNGSIQNNGSVPATTGIVPLTVEKVIHFLELSNGIGTLAESVVDLDLNGNGNKTDKFEVRWSSTATRFLDATIDGVHVYSFCEGTPENPWSSLTYFIDGEPKFFQLGNKKHNLYFAREDLAVFGLDTYLLYSPSPAIIVVIGTQLGETSTIEHITTADFKINGKSVEVNCTFNITYIWDTSWVEQLHFIPNQAFEIGAGEEVNISCNFMADQTITIDVYIAVAWSPDGYNRSYWEFSDLEDGIWAHQIVVSQSTTTTSTITTRNEVPGFSLITTLALMLPMVFLVQKRKNKF